MDIDDSNKNPVRNTSGLAGEFFVLAELLKRGYQASFTLGNAKTVDIFSSDHKTGKTVRIQVKTNSQYCGQFSITKSSVNQQVFAPLMN